MENLRFSINLMSAWMKPSKKGHVAGTYNGNALCSEGVIVYRALDGSAKALRFDFQSDFGIGVDSDLENPIGKEMADLLYEAVWQMTGIALHLTDREQMLHMGEFSHRFLSARDKEQESSQ